MEKLKHINIFNHPVIWFKDKNKTLFSNPIVYIPTLLVWVASLIGFINGVSTFLNSNELAGSVLIYVLTTYVFILGIINLMLLSNSQSLTIKLKREEAALSFIHCQLIHKIRDYRAQKESNCFTKNQIEGKIVTILETLNDRYLIPRHGEKIGCTLKYIQNNKLHAIRVGYNDGPRKSYSPENIENCHVFKVLTEGEPLKFLYVKDIKKPDIYETAAMGKTINKIQGRAKTIGYNTFMALPIFTGNLSPDPIIHQIKIPLGILGFDSDSAYALGNLTEREIDFLGTFVDCISELIYDLN